MEALVDLSWRPFPSAVLIIIGLATAWAGSGLAARGLRQRAGGGSNMQDFVRGFRFAVIGLVLAGLGAAWWWHVKWLFVLSLVFGGEEILESTVHLAILRWKPKVGTQKSAALRRTTGAQLDRQFSRYRLPSTYRKGG